MNKVTQISKIRQVLATCFKKLRVIPQAEPPCRLGGRPLIKGSWRRPPPPNVSAPCAPTSRGKSRCRQTAAPRAAAKRRSSWRADARGALRVTIALDALANGASKPSGLSGNACEVEVRVRNREFLCSPLPVAQPCSTPTRPARLLVAPPRRSLLFRGLPLVLLLYVTKVVVRRREAVGRNNGSTKWGAQRVINRNARELQGDGAGHAATRTFRAARFSRPSNSVVLGLSL